MSDLLKPSELHESYQPDHCNAIELIIEPDEKDLGGFSVRRLLPVAKQRMVGPWIFFDHMGPATFPAGKGIDVRPHPHINLATVTYLFEGEILHRDSLGSYQPITPGDINLMVAGKGITHSERERPEIRNVEHRTHGIQLWLALPENDENIAPSFHHYPKQDIPKVIVEDVSVTVMMGQAYGVTSPVKTFAQTLYIEAYLQKGQTLTLPPAQERAVYIAQGALKAKETALTEHTMTVFAPKDNIVIEATTETRIAIIGGEKMDKRHVFWNFVSSNPQAIEQAKQDWLDGKFAKVVGDEDEFIPLPGK